MKNQLLLFILLLSSPVFAQETVYQIFEVDSAAQPRGGMAYLNAFLQTNLHKPIPVGAKGLGGRIIVSGIVETNGHISAAKVTSSKSPELDREAVRVFGLFNAWQPALKGGKAVRQQVSFPVTFKPNPPFAYVEGARIDYFDDERKRVAEGSEQVRYKQVSPMDTNGLPTGDLIVYKGKETKWKEDYRLTFVRSKSGPSNFSGKANYAIGYQNEAKQWQGDVFTIDDSKTLLRQDHYENGRPSGSYVSYYANGLVAEQTEDVDRRQTSTSWYTNGQIKQIWTINKTNSPFTGSPEQVTAFWDSTGRQLVREGNGPVLYTNTARSYADTTQKTVLIEQGLYTNGFKQGTWTGRYADGSYFYQEQYDKGVCQGGKAITAGSDTTQYTSPLQQPEFPGGMQGLGQFLSQNLRYPANAQRARVQGQVFVSFVVCTDGTLCDYEVLKSVDPSVDQEAVRVVKAMSGRWKPGTQRGQKVRVKFNPPINFTLQ